MDSVKDTLGKWGKMAADTTKKAQDLSGNVWQYCKKQLPCPFFFVKSVMNLVYVWLFYWYIVSFCFVWRTSVVLEIWTEDSLIGKQEPLHDYEEALKKKLITELLS